MEGTTSLRTPPGLSSFHSSEQLHHEPPLPRWEKGPKKRPIRIPALFGRFLCRRVLIWTIALLGLGTIAILKNSHVRLIDGNKLPNNYFPPAGSDGLSMAVELKTNKVGTAPAPGSYVAVQQHGVPEQQGRRYDMDEDEILKQDARLREVMSRMPWLRYKHLDGYFYGVRALVNKSDHVPEYPNEDRMAPFPRPPISKEVPKPRPYNPYQADDDRQTCYLDQDNTIPAPAMYAYQGIPQYMPEPSLGSYEVLGLRDDVCFDRFGRYGPYGLGYTKRQGGSGVGLDTESSGSEAVWAESGQIDYNRVNWGDAQERCSAANQHRFLEPDTLTKQLPVSEESRKGKRGRIAVVIRCYTGFKWTELSILNVRAMITELSLKSGAEYSVHLLLHVRDDTQPIWADDVTVQRVLDANVPGEFHSTVTLWSESQMRLFYPGYFGKSLKNPSGGDIHGVYRSAHLALQIFAMQHPEYEHFWNWEMDMRYLGNYYELLDRLGRWAGEQPRPLLWERSARYFIQALHGSWENFTQSVQLDTMHSSEHPILGPVSFAGRKALRHEQLGESLLPDSCASNRDWGLCGVGEAADLVTLNPIFDTFESGWVFSDDVTGYDEPSSLEPPRRCAIVTASRLSRRLLAAMHEQVWRHRHSMFAEMFPASVALHYGFKAVYAPHPVLLDRAWYPVGTSVDGAFNGGRDHSTSGKGSPFDFDNEHNHKGTSWYYNSEFAGLLWRRWLGYAQMDGRGRFGGRGGQGTLRGGLSEESRQDSTGRMCLRSMLVHPIKHERPTEQ